MKSTFKTKLLSRIKSLKSRWSDLIEIDATVDWEIQYILKLENEIHYKLTNNQIFDAEIIFIYYFETCLSLSEKLISIKQPAKALKWLEGPVKILTRKTERVISGDKYFYMMYKLFDWKAFCYSKLHKSILTLKSLKIALCNANRVEKLLKSEINFPGLYFNIA